MLFGNPSLMTRLAVGKTVGMSVGLIGLLIIPFVWPDMGWMDRIGFLLWYTTMGAFIGLAGVMTWHPILKMRMPWWFMSFWIGTWMNLVLTLLLFEKLEVLMSQLDGALAAFRSPFWFVVEGALVGLLIGYLCTRMGGEGPETTAPLIRPA